MHGFVGFVLWQKLVSRFVYLFPASFTQRVSSCELRCQTSQTRLTRNPSTYLRKQAAAHYREFEHFCGKSGNLLKAIKDAKSWITGKYYIPVQELEDEIIFSDIDSMQNLLTLYPPTRPKREDENTLSAAQEAETDGILRGGEEREDEGEAEERAGFAQA